MNNEGYKITITKYYDKESSRSEYIGKEGDGANGSGYVLIPYVKREEDQIYSQMVDEVNIKNIIDAVNKEDK